MSFKVTIINNENGEVLVNEENAVAIIGSITNKDSARGVGFTDCNAIQLAHAVSTAKKSINKLIEDKPFVEFLSEIADKISSDEGEDEA